MKELDHANWHNIAINPPDYNKKFTNKKKMYFKRYVRALLKDNKNIIKRKQSTHIKSDGIQKTIKDIFTKHYPNRKNIDVSFNKADPVFMKIKPFMELNLNIIPQVGDIHQQPHGIQQNLIICGRFGRVSFIDIDYYKKWDEVKTSQVIKNVKCPRGFYFRRINMGHHACTRFND